MGSPFSRFRSEKNVRILLTGLDAVGKTTILYRIKFWEEEMAAVAPTIGYKVENVDYKGLSIAVWDMKGGDCASWHNLDRDTGIYSKTDALVFVLDTSDWETVKGAASSLQYYLKEAKLSNVPLLLFANKQDVPGALSVERVTEQLRIQLTISRKWHVQPCCALSGDGLVEGMDWLYHAMNELHDGDSGTKNTTSHCHEDTVKVDCEDIQTYIHYNPYRFICLRNQPLAAGLNKLKSMVFG